MHETNGELETWDHLLYAMVLELAKNGDLTATERN
jgi:hypothetical protein